jgi:hypothetical protein
LLVLQASLLSHLNLGVVSLKTLSPLLNLHNEPIEELVDLIVHHVFIVRQLPMRVVSGLQPMSKFSQSRLNLRKQFSNLRQKLLVYQNENIKHLLCCRLFILF